MAETQHWSVGLRNKLEAKEVSSRLGHPSGVMETLHHDRWMAEVSVDLL